MTQTRTRSRHKVIPFFVRVQNNVFRGLGERQMTGSMCEGSGGTEASRLAADVGKYISSPEKDEWCD